MPASLKPAQAAILLLTFSALGYAGGSVALRRADFSESPTIRSVAHLPTDGASLSPVRAGGQVNTSSDAGKDSGEFPPARIRSLLVRLGIDPSLALRLAAVDAAAFPEPFKREAVATNLSTLLQALPQHERDQLLAPLRK